MILRVFIAALLALVLHLFLGWLWVILAGIVGGLVATRHGWFVGLFGVLISWSLLLLWNFIVAGPETLTALNTFGGMIGEGVRGIALVGATLVMGAVIGLIGGLIGTQLRLLTWQRQKNTL